MKIRDIEPLLSRLFGAYPNFKPDQRTMAVYVQFVADIPLADLEVVINQCMLDHPTFCPQPAHLRNCWIELTAGVDLGADEAWGLVLHAIRRVGYLATPTFANEDVAAVVATMGWQEICLSENQVADRAHFMRMYEARLARRKRERSWLPSTRQLVDHYGNARNEAKQLAAPAPRALPEPKDAPLSRVAYRSGAPFKPIGDFLARKLAELKQAAIESEE